MIPKLKFQTHLVLTILIQWLPLNGITVFNRFMLSILSKLASNKELYVSSSFGYCYHFLNVTNLDPFITKLLKKLKTYNLL